ncbi:MAG: hypothetical protein Q9M31_04540 [Mariprofundus sp.]|nr:hypothetical protein [Mariprofundus sp.]
MAWWKSVLLFLLALLLFLALRWQPDSWLREQIMQASSAYGVSIDYQNIERVGLSLHLTKLQISGATLPVPLLFDSIKVAPAWPQLLQAKPALDVALVWQGVKASAVVSEDAQLVELADLHIATKIAPLLPLVKMQLPIKVAGEFQLTGHLRVDSVTGRPLTGELHGQLLKAAASLFGKPDVLGDYTVELVNKEQKTAWQWQLAGGSGVLLKGTGTLATQANLPKQWRLNGQLHLSGGKVVPPSLKPMLTKPLSFTVAGPLARLRLQPR